MGVRANMKDKKEIFECDYSLSEGDAICRALILVAIIIGSILLTIGYFS